MAPTTEALLASVGIRPGTRCLDLGCGAGQVSRLMGTQVGPAGSVVGLDFDPVKLEGCRSARW
ncbi:MAG: class I SAM-dependent methyltransferase [Gemmatimonadales bacterium]